MQENLVIVKSLIPSNINFYRQRLAHSFIHSFIHCAGEGEPCYREVPDPDQDPAVPPDPDAAGRAGQRGGGSHRMVQEC